MLHAREILSLADSPLFGRVLQCPVALEVGPDSLDLLVSSRDGDNRSRILSVRIECTDGPSPRLVRCSPVVEPPDIDPGCVGVMSGDVIEGISGPVLLGNAYFLDGGRLGSRLFAMPLVRRRWAGDDDALGATREITWLWPDDDDIFRATPALVTLGGGSFLVYLRALTSPPPDARFPSGYRLHRIGLSGDLEFTGEEEALPPGVSVGSWAKPAQDPEDPPSVWFCHRGVTTEDAGYRLGRMTLGAGGAVGAVELSDNGGLGDAPAGLGMLAYPEPLPGGAVIACAGEFGSSGLVLLRGERAGERAG